MVQQAYQVFYVKDPTSEHSYVVLHRKKQRETVPTRSPGMMTCPASDGVGRAQQDTWTRERGMVQKCT